ncbi:MAG: hypothetical protein OEW08_11760 [Gammaproteobacteria bacterium]|nr:hypothetical protein [Gammaproteobacteria bacterium]
MDVATDFDLEGRLYTQLADAGLNAWTPILMTLIAHYNGLGEIIELPQLSPIRQFADVVEAAAASHRELRAVLLRQRLARLPVFYYRAAHLTTGECWKPLVEPLCAFTQRGPTRYWQHWLPQPTPAQVEVWLKMKLSKR